MHHNDGFGPRRDQSFNMFRVYGRLAQIDDIREHWGSTNCRGHVGRRDEIQRGLDDLVPWTELPER